MKAFATLVRNDMGFNFGGIRRKHRYFWIYAAIAVMIWLFQYAITLDGASRFTIDPRYALFAIVPAFFILSGSVVSREWRGDTAGWWLTLPYSRAKLLCAKTLSSFIREITLIFVMAAVLALLFLGCLLMRPDLVTAVAASTYASQCLQLLALLVVFSPFVVASGMLIRLIARSKWKAASPLLWVGLPTAFCYFIALFAAGGQSDQTLMDTVWRVCGNGLPNFLLFLAAEGAATMVFMLFSVYLLKRQIEL